MRRHIRTALAAIPFILLFACGGPVDGPAADVEAPSSDREVDTSQSRLLYDVMGSSKQNGFNAPIRSHGWFCIADEHCDVGDFNRDGRDDIVTILPSGAVYVALSNPSGLGYTSTRIWSNAIGFPNAQYAVGDVDGDGRDDIVRFLPQYGFVYVARSTGSSFETLRFARSGVCRTGEVCKLGDVNRDGRADLVRFIRGTRTDSLRGDVQVALSGGITFGTPSTWITDFCISNTEVCDVGDFTRDGAADIVAFPSRAVYGTDGGAWVAISNRSNAFTRRHQALTNACPTGYHCTTGDADGDGRDDIVSFANGTGFAASGYDYRDDVHVAHVFGSFTPPFLEFTAPRIRAESFCPSGHVCRVGDMNGDGRDDLVAFARDSLSGSGRGDVFVARSNYGDPRTFVLDFNTIAASTTEGSGDKPLLLGFGFRSTFGRGGSTVITRNTYNETFATGIVAGGPSVTIPASVGHFTFAGVSLLSPAQVMSARPMEIFGAAVVMIEKDLTAAAAYPGLMDEVDRALRFILQRTVEQTSMLELATPGAFEEALEDAADDLVGEIAVDVIDNVLHFALSAPWDPDDIVDFHVVLFPAVDKSMGDMMPPSPNPEFVNIAVPGEGWLGNYFTNIVFEQPWQSMRYLVSTRLR